MAKNRFIKASLGELDPNEVLCRGTMSKGTPCIRAEYAGGLCPTHFREFIGHEFGNVCAYEGVCGAVKNKGCSIWSCAKHWEQFADDDPHSSGPCTGCIECYDCGKRCCDRDEIPDLHMEPCPFKSDTIGKLDIPESVIRNCIRLVLLEAGWQEPFHVNMTETGYVCWSENPANNTQTRIEEDKWLKIGKQKITEVRRWLRNPNYPEAQR